MPSVDQRVVELEFDNKDFSSRVESTMSSLKSLESSIQNMGGSAKGVSEVSNALGRMNISPILDAAESVTEKFSVMRAVATAAINRITNAVMDAGKKLVSFVPNQIMSGGWARASNIAKAKFTIEGLLKEGDSWKQLQEDINYGVADTAYGFDAAAMAASSFYASGIKQGEQMQTSLRAVSGVAAMTNSSYEEIANIFTTVAGNGRLMGQQLTQLSYRGMNAAATLADQMGITEEEVRQLVSQGKISFDEFATAMDNAFGEHAKDANQTFIGAIANVKAALSRIGAEFAAPFQDAMIPVLNAIRPIINAIKSVLTPVFGDFDTFIHKVSDKAVSFLNIIQRQVDPALKTITEKDWSKLGNAPYLDILKEKLLEAGRAAADDGEEFDEMIASYGSFEESLESGWLTKGVFDKATESLKDMSEEMGALEISAGEASVTMEQLWQWAHEVERGDWGNGQERFDRLTAAGISYHDVQQLVNHDLLGWDYSLESLGETLQATGEYTDEQVEAIVAFAQELEDSGSSLQSFMGLFDSFDKMTTFEYLVEGARNLATYLEMIGTRIGTAFSYVFNLKGIENLPDLIHDIAGSFYVWSNSLNDTSDNGRTVFNVAKTIFTVIKTLFDVVQKVGGAFVDIAGQIARLITPFGQVFDAFVGAFGRADDVVSDLSGGLSIFDTVLSKITDGVEKAVNFLEPFVQKLADWITKQIELNSTTDKLKGTFDALSSFATSMWTTIRDAFSWIAPYVQEAFDRIPGIISGAISLISDKVGGVSSVISGMIGSMFGGNVEAGGIAASFKDFFDALASGEGILDSFLTLISDGFSTVMDLNKDFREFIGGIVPSVNSAFGDGSDAKSAASGLITVFQDLRGEAEATASAFGSDSEFGSAMTGLSVVLENLFGAVQNLSQFIKDMNLEQFDTLFGYFMQGGSLVMLYQMVKGFRTGADAFEGLSGAINNLSAAIAGPWGTIAQGLKNFGEAVRPSKFFEISLALSALALSLWLLAGVPGPDLIKAALAMAAAAGIIVGVSALMSHIGEKMSPEAAGRLMMIGESLLMLAGAIALVAAACLLLSMCKWEDLAKGGAALAGLTGAAILISKFSANDIRNTASAMISFGVALTILAIPITILGLLPWPVVTQGLIAVGTAMLVMGAAFKIMGSVNISGIAASMLGFAVAMVILTGVIAILGSMQIDQLVQGFVALAGISLVLVGVLGALFFAISAFPKINTASLFAIGAAFTLMGVGMLAAAGAVYVLGQLGDTVWTAVAAFAAIAVIMGAFILLLGTMGGAVLAGGAGMLLFGAGVVLVGAGLLLVADSLAKLSMVLIPFSASLTIFAEQFARSAESLGEGIGKGISAMITAIGEAAGPIGSALASLAGQALSALAGGFINNVGTIVSTLSDMFASFADAIVPELPRFTEKGVDIITALLDGLGEQASSLAQAALDLVTDLINALADALENAGESMREACNHLVQSIIDFIIEFITGKDQEVGEEGETIGESIVDGIGTGLEGLASKAMGKIQEGIQSLIDKAKALLGIASPSTVFEGIGQDIINGLLNGLNNLISKPVDAIGGLVEDIIGKFSNSKIGKAAKGTVDEIGKAFREVKKDPVGAIQTGLSMVVDKVESFAPNMLSNAKSFIGKFTEGIISGQSPAGSAMSAIVSTVKTNADQTRANLDNAGKNGIKAYNTALSSGKSGASSATSSVVRSAISAVQGAVGSFRSSGSSSSSGYNSGISSNSGGAYSAAAGVARSGRSGAGSVSFYSTGRDLIWGLIDGLNSLAGRAYSAASSIGHGMNNALRSAGVINSPSKVWLKIGGEFIEGLCLGLDTYRSEAEESAANVAKAMEPAITKACDMIADSMDDDFALNPLVTPIVDMDNVKAASTMIDSMLSDQYGMRLGGSLGNYNLYGGTPLSESKSVVNNVSVMLQYEAGSDANLMATELASALKSKLDLEG